MRTIINDTNYIEKQEREAIKKFLWISVPVWVILATLSCRINLRQGIYVDGDFLYSEGQGYFCRQQDEICMYEEGPDTRFEVIWDGIKKDATLVWGEAVGNNGTQVYVTFQDGNIIEGIWNGENLSDAEGKDLAFGRFDVVVTVNGKRSPVSDIAWSKIFCRLSLGDTDTKGSIVFIFIGTMSYVLGVLSFLFPDKTHFFLRGWQYERAELSDAGRLIAKTGGIVVMVLGGIIMLQIFL